MSPDDKRKLLEQQFFVARPDLDSELALDEFTESPASIPPVEKFFGLRRVRWDPAENRQIRRLEQGVNEQFFLCIMPTLAAVKRAVHEFSVAQHAHVRFDTPLFRVPYYAGGCL